jgi:hypothetical protein
VKIEAHFRELASWPYPLFATQPDKPIAFVFDQQKEMEGRAKLLYDAVK